MDVKKAFVSLRRFVREESERLGSVHRSFLYGLILTFMFVMLEFVAARQNRPFCFLTLWEQITNSGQNERNVFLFCLRDPSFFLFLAGMFIPACVETADLMGVCREKNVSSKWAELLLMYVVLGFVWAMANCTALVFSDKICINDLKFLVVLTFPYCLSVYWFLALLRRSLDNSGSQKKLEK